MIISELPEVLKFFWFCRMDSEIQDLLDESGIVVFTDVASHLQVHVNKGTVCYENSDRLYNGVFYELWFFCES